ncbi:MAG TPA: type II secretion system minor pseudopilin GspI [Gallionellaceae bacterium]|nr:type II secretion system minor pseudopilin GspI [Gallionellaceae bacterium]
MQGKFAYKGFTLLETLVALAILAIAMAAVMRATGAGTNHAETMRMRVLADWVAQNRLAQHAARGDFLPPGTQNGEETQAGIRLIWKEDIGVTPNPAFRRIEVSVYSPDDPEYALRRLTGFLVQQRR